MTGILLLLGALVLGVTETAALEPRYAGVLRELADAGVRIALDDFGTGFSGLSTLRDFPFSAIKPDRSFVSSLHKSPRERALVQTMTLRARRKINRSIRRRSIPFAVVSISRA